MFGYKYDDLFNPTLVVLRQLGGSATIEELKNGIIKYLKISDKDAEEIHKGNTTKLEYRLAWVRTYLKRYGLLENSSVGVWALTPQAANVKEVDPGVVRKFSADMFRKKNRNQAQNEKNSVTDENIDEDINWKTQILEIIRTISPASFERLTQRLLRELGFSNVEVTGRSGDGGIDGKGIVKINGVLSFHVAFQCKRYNRTRTIGPNLIRELRGAMGPHADKGLLVTTGRFSAGARRAAVEAGFPPIDLIDGNEFAERLKALGLGVAIRKIVTEEISINKEWFNNI